MTTIPFGQLVCQCGKTYAPTCEGLWLHRRLFDHTPSEAHEKTTEQKWSEATERAFSQVRRYDGGTSEGPRIAPETPLPPRVSEATK